MLNYEVRRDSQIIGRGQIEPPFQIGRQNKDELDLRPVCVSTRGDMRRLIVVKIVDVGMPRQAVNVSLQDGKISVASLMPLPCEVRLGPQADQGNSAAPNTPEADQEVTLFFQNGISVHIQPSESAENLGEYVSLAQFRTQGQLYEREQSLLDVSPEIQADAVNLIKSALRLYSEVPGSPNFFTSVATTVRKLIEVDRVAILQREKDEWIPTTELADAASPDETIAVDGSTVGRRFSRTLIQRVLASRETQIVELSGRVEFSMMGVQRAVASPIFDDAGEVLAILYADKSLGYQDQPISLLQASLVDIVASAISNAMLRQRDAEFRTTTGQFFSKSVLDRLSKQKDLLEGRDAEVSILFCDIRGFSRIAYQVGPTETIGWINDVLTSLSECILDQDGVVVDYVGDAVMAMFGAPEPQEDHASRACRAALEMIRRVPELNTRHQSLTTDFKLGIGINSGIARVGNTGSRIKFKYGPLGTTVNMASRVESITKKFGVSCIFTESTRALLSQAFLSRRLSRIRVVGIPEPVDIYQLMPEENEDLQSLCSRYEQALQLFEAQNFTEAIAQFANVKKCWDTDTPSKLMLKRCVDAMNSSQPFDAVFNLLSK
ncbi:MAG: hypothetical protein IT423_14000 [Pirellulaceae bacterium]|nr:hypothetical protein [Pirellulaceae bacterium]